MVYFYEKREFTCPACDAILVWETRRVFTVHGDRMSVVHPQTEISKDVPCPHAGKHFYAPGVEFSEIK